MAEIRWTKEAVSWLQDIHSYVSNDSQNIANKVIDILGVFHGSLDIERYLKI